MVEGVNRVYKHLKPTRRNPQGGRLSKEMPVDASNVMLIDPATNAADPRRRPVRRRRQQGAVRQEERQPRIRVLSKPDPKYAAKK